jgi:ADP-ribose pyrophosphatase YjhB (NUDIX family)
VASIQRFAAAVAGVLIDNTGRVLLIREREGEGEYGLPGGIVPDYESPDEAVVREILLQTDVTARVQHLVGLRYRAEEQRSLLLLVYRCAFVRGSARLTAYGELAEVNWFRARALPDPLSSSAGPAIEAALAGGRGVILPEPPVEQAMRKRFQVHRGG